MEFFFLKVQIDELKSVSKPITQKEVTRNKMIGIIFLFIETVQVKLIYLHILIHKVIAFSPEQ